MENNGAWVFALLLLLVRTPNNGKPNMPYKPSKDANNEKNTVYDAPNAVNRIS